MDIGLDNVELVVTRYNEDLSWMSDHPFNKFKYIIYNKGDNDNFEKKYAKTIINLPNIGRCDHTVFYHIVENYNTLSNIMVFLPGSIDQKYLIKQRRAALILNSIIKSGYKTAFFVGEDINRIGLKKRFETFRLDNWCCTHPDNKSKNHEHVLEKSAIRPFGQWYDHHFKDIQPIDDIEPDTFAYWGIFSLDKRDIIQHDIDRYRTFLGLLSNSSNPEVGHYFERAWCAVFHPMRHTVVGSDK